MLTIGVFARLVPQPDLHPDGVSLPNSCGWLGRSPPLDVLLAHYRRAQRPRDCASARYLLLDDLNEQTGLGFGFLALHVIFLQALSENRTLLPSSAVLPSEHWRWCDTGTRDYSCYFAPWSSDSCQRHVAAWANASSDAPPPWWDRDGMGQGSLSSRIVRLRLTEEPTQEAIFAIYRKWMHCIPSVGRSWWWAASWDVLLRFQPWVERRAIDFLREHGVRIAADARPGAPGIVAAAEPFAVVIVRHGGKFVEEKLVRVGEYFKPLDKLLGKGCLNGRHVLLVTETASVVRNFSAACAARGWNCFWSAQRRLDLNIDPWNPTDPRNAHGHAQEAMLTDAAGLSRRALLHHIGWHSILNLAVSQHGAALIGSFGSSWSQLTLSMMHRRHRAPVLGCSLRPGWKGDNMYTRFTPEGARGVHHVSPACRRAMTPLCRGGELMYEGLGLTWHKSNRKLRPEEA